MRSLITSCMILLSLFIADGCKKEDSNPIGADGHTNDGLFTTAGLFAFKSSQSDFSVTGIFDTTMSKGQAAGAFSYKDGSTDYLLVIGYKVNPDSSFSIGFMAIADTMNALTTTSYPFGSLSGSKTAVLGYMPSFNPKTGSGFGMYTLTSGSVVISALTGNFVQGTISGKGVQVTDTTQSITVAQGAFAVPIVKHQPAANTHLNASYAAPNPVALRVVQQMIKMKL